MNVFRPLDTVPPTARFLWLPTKPAHFHENTLIIPYGEDRNDGENTIGIYEYNLDTNHIQKINDHIIEKFFESSHFIDPANNILYLFHYDVYKFDLITKQYINNIHPSSKLLLNFNTPCIDSHYIADLNQIHITGARYYVIYNTVNQTFIELPSLEYYYMCWPKLLFIPRTKQLTAFGWNQCDLICSCDTNKNEKHNECNWIVKGIRMSSKATISDYETFLAFEHLVFCFYLSKENSIWIFDVLQEKWYLSHCSIPLHIGLTGEDIYAFMRKAKIIEVINFKTGQRLQANLYDLIPNELNKIYSNKYTLLVIGWIRNMQKKKCMKHIIAHDLIMLIWKFFPSFI